ncbi:MAG: flagellar export protein FliJ [Candidatus Cloacimonadota bacterium]|nr:flagellar export protein FliJ [Candidatus Cloacimonadota bacterium]
MKKFKFSLDKVKELRATQEKLIMKELSVAQHKLYSAENKRDTIKDEITNQWESRSKNKPTNSYKIMTVISYIESLEEKLSLLDIEINQLEEKISEIRDRLLDKVKEKKTLEKLKELKKLEFNKLMKKKEQEIMDEISIQSFGKRARESNE